MERNVATCWKCSVCTKPDIPSWARLPSTDIMHLVMKHFVVTSILPATGKFHTVSPLFTKNMWVSRKKSALGDKRFTQGEEMKLPLI